MNKINYKPLKEKIEIDKILDIVFKDSSVKHGLQEFPKEILKRINDFEKEKGKFYVRCLKRGKDIFIYGMLEGK
jgi:tRNA(Ser,Leu) C12 N-acetylase TAN1